MRCKNCGWPNEPNTGKCVKCGNPLGEESSEHFTSREKSNNDDVSEGTKKTVMENRVFGQERKSSPIVNENPACPKCGYPLRPNTEKCPNCNHQLNDATPQPASPVHRGTINPYMKAQQSVPGFTLQPVLRIDEDRNVQTAEFKGEEVILNRDNTDPDNPSITSREQAVVTYESGHWYVEDRSDLKTTFVQAGRKFELQDGDLLLLGDRLFEFKKR